MSCTFSPERIDQTIDFHGHRCPGLAIGIRVAELALREVGHNRDGGVTAVVETDMCGVDAVQYLTGCTYGKGNLIHQDYGKGAFSFFRSADGKAVRIMLRSDAGGSLRELARTLRQKVDGGTATEDERQRHAGMREEMISYYLQADLDQLFTVTPLQAAPPRPARILQSLVCASCGELTMESRTRRFDGQVLCIPCFAAVEQKI